MADLFRLNRDLEAALARANGEQPFLEEKPVPTWATVQAAFAALEAGNAEFAGEIAGKVDRPFPDLHSEWRRDVAVNHSRYDDTPLAAVLCCSDHRASPELIFWQGLGRLFVIRDAGNLLDDHGVGGLEYALEVLRVPLIVVLGHEGCGAVVAAVSTFQKGCMLPGTKLPALVERFGTLWAGRPGGNPVDETWLSHASLARTKADIERIPLVRDRLAGNNLAVVTGRYDVESGIVSWIGATPTRPLPAI